MSYGIIDVVKDLVTGKLKFVNRKIAKDRYAVCQSCEMRNSAANVCTVCGCYLPAKVILEKSSCPVEYW